MVVQPVWVDTRAACSDGFAQCWVVGWGVMHCGCSCCELFGVCCAETGLLRTVPSPMHAACIICRLGMMYQQC